MWEGEDYVSVGLSITLWSKLALCGGGWGLAVMGGGRGGTVLTVVDVVCAPH